MAITDECSLSGVVRAHVAARSTRLKLLIGSRFVLQDGLAFLLLARNRRGYGQLSHLITQGRRAARKGQYLIDRSLVEQQCLDECLGLWLPPEQEAPKEPLQWLQQQLPGRVWIAVELLLRGDDRRRLESLQALGARLGIPLTASGAVCMHEPLRQRLLDTLTAIRLGTTLARLGKAAAANREQCLRSRERLAKLYPASLMEESARIASLCHFSLDELRYEYPHELVPSGHSASSWLRTLTQQGMSARWPGGVPEKVQVQVEKELILIAELQYEHFFLTVHDLVVFARSRGILCQGRGSAANSAVCYCLGVTAVDPGSMELLFERFLSKERNEPPDIDVDFEHERREEVIQYVYSKYGRHRAALAATVICYRARSAIRDVAAALGISLQALSAASRRARRYANMPEAPFEAGAEVSPATLQHFMALVRTLIGFPRHLSQHVGGFVISQGPLSELVPVENAAMADRTVIQWEKDDLEALGLLKVDVLALGMLSAIRKALALVNASPWRRQAPPLALHEIFGDDEKVYDMICAADTVGLFQIESRAQMSMLPRLRPRHYYDLVIQIAIVRPGPIQGDMVHPYLARRQDPNLVDYPSPAVEGVLKRTLGVPIFQEQVMQIAIVAAGFTGGEADQLRRAMAAWKKKGGLEPFRDKLIKGMLERGYSEQFALQIYNQIKGFADYGFPESHSASFALLAYVSAWLKYYHPAAFTCALLNSQPMGFYGPSQLVQDVRRHGVEVLPVDVNRSDWDCTLVYSDVPGSAPRLRLGLRLVKGLSEAGAMQLCAARRAGDFATVQALIMRSGIHERDRESLAAADALRSLSHDRHQAFWAVAGYEAPLPLCAGAADWPDPVSTPVLLPKPSEGQDIMADYNSVGLSLRRHPLALFREHLHAHQVCAATVLSELDNGRRVKVAGIVTARQRPQTASGVTFMTLEDESGFLNVIVWPAVAEAHESAVYEARLLGVAGHVQTGDGVTHVIASNLTDLSHWLADMALPSRDFC